MDAFLHGAAVFFAYLLPAAALMLTARSLIRIPDELFRKILHFILLGAYIPLVFAFDVWWMAACLAAALAAALYPLLLLAGRIEGFTEFTTQRREGEFASSMVLALLTMTLSVTVCWGVFADRYLVLACVYAWGVGDAFAALIGKQFGRHKLRFRYADPRKSIEGTAAMFLSSAASVCAVLLLRGGMAPLSCALTALPAAAVCAFVELCTRGGYDTITCPAAAMAVILPLIHLFGG